MRLIAGTGTLLLLCGAALPSLAAEGLPVLNVIREGAGGQRYSLTLELLALMTVLTVLPSLLLIWLGAWRFLSYLRLAADGGSPDTML